MRRWRGRLGGIRRGRVSGILRERYANFLLVGNGQLTRG